MTGSGMSLYAKRIEKGRFVWPSAKDGMVSLTGSQLACLCCVPLERKAWLFCGSDRGGHRAAVLYTLIQTTRLNDVDPQAWLADVLARIADLSVSKLGELLPWNWRTSQA
jgi:transposase